MAEKRIKLGLDNNELENQLNRINQLIRSNYELSIQGQQRYNTFLQGTNALLGEEIEKLTSIGDIQRKLLSDLNNSQQQVSQRDSLLQGPIQSPNSPLPNPFADREGINSEGGNRRRENLAPNLPLEEENQQQEISPNRPLSDREIQSPSPENQQINNESNITNVTNETTNITNETNSTPIDVGRILNELKELLSTINRPVAPSNSERIENSDRGQDRSSVADSSDIAFPTTPLTPAADSAVGNFDFQSSFQEIVTNLEQVNESIRSIDLEIVNEYTGTIAENTASLVEALEGINTEELKTTIGDLPFDDIIKELTKANTSLDNIERDLDDLINRPAPSPGNSGGSSGVAPTPAPMPGPGIGGGGNAGGGPNDTADNNIVGRAGQVANTAASIAVSRNEAYMLAGVASLVPIIGQGLGMIFNKLLSEGDALTSARDAYYATSGRHGGVRGLNEIGLTTAETYQASIAYRQAYNRRNFEDDLYAEKAFNIDRGNLTSLARSMRNESNSYAYYNLDREGRYRGDIVRETYQNDLTAGQAVNIMLANLQNIVGRDDARAYINDYLQTLVSLNRDQLMATGETNTIINTQLISSIANLGEKFQNPEVLNQIIGSLKQGLTQAASPQIEALQFATLTQMNPNASLWDLYKMRSDPFGEGNEQYMNRYLTNLVNISGGGDEAYFNVASAFNLQHAPKLVEDIVNAVRERRFGDAVTTLTGAYNLAAEGAAATSPMQRMTAETSDMFAEWGEGLTNTLVSITDTVKGQIDKIKADLGSGKSFGDIAEGYLAQIAEGIWELVKIGGGKSTTSTVPSIYGNSVKDGNGNKVPAKMTFGSRQGIM